VNWWGRLGRGLDAIPAFLGMIDPRTGYLSDD
jgi:hypothetical protein